MTNYRIICTAVLLIAASAADRAAADPLRDLCVDRPGKDTPACIVDKGHALVEIGAVGYTRGPEAGVDEYALGAVLARFGLTDTAELQLGFTPYTVVRTTDAVTGRSETRGGAGDLTIAVRRNFRSPDGSGIAIAGQFFVTAPTAADAIGAGAWEGGVIIPVSFDLSDRVNLTIDPEIDINGNADGAGHHLAYVGVASLRRDLGAGLTGSAEIWSMIDRDPAAPMTQASFDVMLAWAPVRRNDLQFDMEVDLGLTADTPSVEVLAGVAWRF